MSIVSEGPPSVFYCANYHVRCDKLIAHRISEAPFETLITLTVLRCHINNYQWMAPLLDSYILTFVSKGAVQCNNKVQKVQNLLRRIGTWELVGLLGSNDSRALIFCKSLHTPFAKQNP